MFVTAEERFQERMRRKTERRLGNSDNQEQARRAGQFASERILRSCASVPALQTNTSGGGDLAPSASFRSAAGAYGASSPDNTGIHRMSVNPPGLRTSATGDTDQLLPNIPSFDLSVDSSDVESFASAEYHDPSARAVRRGLRRGQREVSESRSYHSESSRRRGRRNDDDFDLDSDIFDLTTVTDAFTDFTTKESGKNEKKKKKRGKKKKKGKEAKGFFEDYEDSEDEGDAWMCGVCGKAFPSLESADKHEDQHLREVIQGLGWAGENGSLSYLYTPSNNNQNGTSFFETDDPSVQPKIEKAADEPSNGEKEKASLKGARRENSPSNWTFGRKRAATDSFLGAMSRRKGGAGHTGNLYGSSAARRERFAEQRLEPPSNDQFQSFTGINPRYEEEKVEEVGDNDKDDTLPPDLMEEFNKDYGEDVPVDTLIPKPRARTFSEVRFEDKVASDPLSGMSSAKKGDAVLMSAILRDYVVLADEALVTVCERAKPMILTETELKAQQQLAWLARDKVYYDEIAERSLARKENPTNRYRSDAENFVGKAQNKLLDAYQLMKEGDNTRGVHDEYTKKKAGDGNDSHTMAHTPQTLYVNVMVKNSVQVVRHELERLARQKWEHPDEDALDKYTKFKRFRVYAHANIVKLAGIALASDFTPRRIAVQLSNDLYRLLAPRLKRRGVTIGTEIEYRVGGYFVLAVNVTSIEWTRFIRTNRRDLMTRKAKWEKAKHVEESNIEEAKKKRFYKRLWEYMKRLFSLTKYDILAQALSFLYNFHWIIYIPLCFTAYHSPVGSVIRKFIISSAIDDIFFYIEQKGMEMQISVHSGDQQAAFMLSALREIRADERALKKKRQETESEETGVILGPLLGPAIKADKGAASPPPGFELPENLESVGLELDLPVGFRRLRWAMLNMKSSFMVDAVWKSGAKYEDITVGEWNKHNDVIGDPSPPPTVNEEDFVGAEFECSYLMPKSAMVNANMAYGTNTIVAYNDYCFCLKSKSRTPDVPFGSTFFAWTQTLVINTGNDSCKMICSVEAEFPNGPPMVARQIQSGMRAGTAEYFVLLGETITRYAGTF